MPKSKQTTTPGLSSEATAFLSTIDSHEKAVQTLRDFSYRVRPVWIGVKGQPPPWNDDDDFRHLAEAAFQLAEKFGFGPQVGPPPPGPMSPYQTSQYLGRVQTAFDDRSKKEYWKRRVETVRRSGKALLPTLVRDCAWEIQRRRQGDAARQATDFLRRVLIELEAYDCVWAAPLGISSGYWLAAVESRKALLEFLPGAEVPPPREGTIPISEALKYLRSLLRIARAARVPAGSRTPSRAPRKRLSPGEIDCLIALLELGGIDEDHRKTSNDVAKRARHADDGAAVRRDLGSLVKRKFCKSSAGKAGGYWLSSTGAERARRAKAS